MHECDYCGETHDSERAHLRHLKSAHRDELGPIDRRRVGDVEVDDGGLPTGPLALGVVVLASFAVVGYVVFIAGSGDAGAGAADHGTIADDGEPYDVGAIHTHGTMEATIDGDEIDFEEDSRIGGSDAFHFHRGYADRFGEQIYHIHARGVTLQYALDALGMEVNDDGTVLTFDGETYDDSDADTTVEITVDGQPVEPADHLLEGVGPEDEAAAGEGDSVRIVVEVDD